MRLTGHCSSASGRMVWLVYPKVFTVMSQATSQSSPSMVDKDPHEFRNGDGRMGVIELDGDLVGELLECFMGLTVAADDVLQGRGHEEVLLFEPQFLSLEHVIVRVEYFGYDFRLVLVRHGQMVIAMIEIIEVEIAR